MNVTSDAGDRPFRSAIRLPSRTVTRSNVAAPWPAGLNARRLGDVFTVSIHAEASTGESDSEEYIMHLDELAEDGRQSVRECDENMDIQSLRAYLASPKGKAYEKAFNLLFLDGLSIEDAAKEMGISYSAFKFNMLRPLREICRHFGFAPKSKQCKTE